MHIKSGIKKVIKSFLPSLSSLPSIPRIPNAAHKYQAYAQRTPVNTWHRADLDQAEYNPIFAFVPTSHYVVDC